MTNRNGRPKGSKNKLPNNEKVNELVNKIVNDFSANYTKLTTNQKIKILSIVRHKLILDEPTFQDFQPVIIQL